MMRSGFFDNTKVWADDFAKFAAGILTNGVIADTESALLVIAPQSGMSVNVNPGYAWISGHFGYNEELTSVELSPADGTNPRIDRVVVRLDYTAHTVSLQTITGAPAASPTAPGVVRNGNIYDLGLATVTIPAGTLNITDAMITDTRRDASICGGVYPRMSDAFIYPGANNIGDIKMTACVAAPDMWMICDGSAISRTRYIGLFSAIGTTYGAGDGSTTFNIPDLRGKTAFGKNIGTFSPLGKTGGSETHSLTVQELASHSHNASASSDLDHGVKVTEPTSTGPRTGDGSIQLNSYSNAITVTIQNTGGGAPFSILPPYIALNYIIYTGVSEI